MTGIGKPAGSAMSAEMTETRREIDATKTGAIAKDVSGLIGRTEAEIAAEMPVAAGAISSHLSIVTAVLKALKTVESTLSEVPIKIRTRKRKIVVGGDAVAIASERSALAVATATGKEADERRATKALLA